MRRTIITALALVILAPCVARCSVWVSPDQYFSMRRQAKALTGKAAASALADPGAAQGKTIEIKGAITGVAQIAERSDFVISCGDRSYIVSSKDTDPQVDPGCAVRMLVRPCGPETSADYVLVATAWDYVITARENQAMAKARTKPAPQRQMTSRGGFQRPDVLVEKWSQVVQPYTRAIMSFNKKLTAPQAQAIACYILEYGQKYDVDPRLVVAVVLAESHFRLDATSRSGAMGLGQLMPGTAAGMGVSNAYDPHQNLSASVRLIRGHLDKLSGGKRWSQLTWDHLFLALASYNAGPGAVRKYGGVPPYRETRTYIARVTSIYRQLCGSK